MFYLRECIQFFCLIILLSFSTEANKNELYDSKTSSIINLNPMNFQTQITNTRSKNVISFIHFYTPNDGKSKEYKNILVDLDREYEGMFKLFGLNCKEYKDLCGKENVNEFPSFMIYPPLPAPVMKYEGKISTTHIISYLGKFVDNKCTEINNNNIENFLNENPSLPKVLLFTDKKNVPLIFKRLSVHFEKKVLFGIVRSDMSGIISKYKVKKYPTIMAIGVDKKQNLYKGEMKYKQIFDFCNIYQETFFVVGKDTTGAETQKKPWMDERFPELTKESGNDICFKVDGAICVLLVNKEKPSDALENIFVSIQNWLSPKINRGAKYKFGWVNSMTQNAFVKSLKLDKGDGPKFVLINHGSRKRYYVYDREINEDRIKNIFDKLVSGDIKFNRFADNKIPELEA